MACLFEQWIGDRLVGDSKEQELFSLGILRFLHIRDRWYRFGLRGILMSKMQDGNYDRKLEETLLSQLWWAGNQVRSTEGCRRRHEFSC
jgi:hypothetical protein